MEGFTSAWADLRHAVAELPDDAFAADSGCAGWLVWDLVFHLVIDAQDVLITLVTPADREPTRDAAGYWEVDEAPSDDADALSALTIRVAAAYEDPALLKFHLDDVGSAAGRAALLADPAARVETMGQVLTVADYLSAYVLEWTLHHLDLIAYLPDVPGPSSASFALSRELLERIAGMPFPPEFSDADALMVGTGRRLPTELERRALGDGAARLPLTLG